MRRMIPQKFQNWIKKIFDKIVHNEDTNTTEFGGNVEVDGNLQVNQSITDIEGNEAIDIGTEDLSIHKNVNIGSVDEVEDLFVSGKIINNVEVKKIIVTEDYYDEEKEENIVELEDGKYLIDANDAIADNTTFIFSGQKLLIKSETFPERAFIAYACGFNEEYTRAKITVYTSEFPNLSISVSNNFVAIDEWYQEK